jgi:hypothetical protein
MLEYLKLEDAGPAPELEVDFAKRLNFLAGDNGLGKTFLLDTAWWALTRTWARQMIMPHRPPTKPQIKYRYGKKGKKPHSYTSVFDRKNEVWPLRQGRPPIPGMVLYAQVDGGFSAWDPARNYWRGEDPDRQPAYLFSSEEVWGGLPLDRPEKLCNGLITDWVNWQLEADEPFDQFKRVLNALSPSVDEKLEPGSIIKKLSLKDSRKHPTIKMPYGQEVPLIHASAGIRRITALAYLLVWTWQEHVASCALRGDNPSKEIIFLIDEIEAHLHPQWQRRIVPALLDVMEALTGSGEANVQLIAATHSPMVLASAETRFDDAQDAVWELDLVESHMELRKYPWHRRGDANSWLTSSVFDLKEPRSQEAEQAILAALALARESSPNAAEIDRVDEMLRNALNDIDRFWVRWTQFRENQRAHGGGK